MIQPDCSVLMHFTNRTSERFLCEGGTGYWVFLRVTLIVLRREREQRSHAWPLDTLVRVRTELSGPGLVRSHLISFARPATHKNYGKLLFHMRTCLWSLSLADVRGVTPGDFWFPWLLRLRHTLSLSLTLGSESDRSYLWHGCHSESSCSGWGWTRDKGSAGRRKHSAKAGTRNPFQLSYFNADDFLFLCSRMSSSSLS